MKQVGYFVTGILVLALLAMWQGFVLCKLWAWFVVDAFGVSPITITTAIGLSLIVGHLRHSETLKDKQSFW
jgi:hypothetical protein